MESYQVHQKKIYINPKLKEEFVKRAKENSESDPPKETGGYLGGFETEDGDFVCDLLLIPNQVGYPDRFNEIETEPAKTVVHYNRVPVGFIHTHPGNYSAFLSSIDLHVQCTFQTQVPESIAIVHSVRYNNTPEFHLTEVGLAVLSSCRENDNHLHNDEVGHLYKLASNVVYDETIEIKIEDLRPKSPLGPTNTFKRKHELLGLFSEEKGTSVKSKSYKEEFYISETDDGLSDSQIPFMDESDDATECENFSFAKEIEKLNEKTRDKRPPVVEFEGINFRRNEKGNERLKLSGKKEKIKKRRKPNNFIEQSSDEDEQTKTPTKRNKIEERPDPLKTVRALLMPQKKPSTSKKKNENFQLDGEEIISKGLSSKRNKYIG